MTAEAEVYNLKMEAQMVMAGEEQKRMYHILETIWAMGLTYLQAEEYILNQMSEHTEDTGHQDLGWDDLRISCGA